MEIKTIQENARIAPSSENRSPELEELAKFYQSILKLSDWEVYVFLVSSCELGSHATHGRCYTSNTHRAAHIYILNDAERNGHTNSNGGKDLFPAETAESILVHELLHIFTEQYFPAERYKEDGSLEWVAMEQSVSAISKALVNLKVALFSKNTPTIS